MFIVPLNVPVSWPAEGVALTKTTDVFAGERLEMLDGEKLKVNPVKPVAAKFIV